MAEITIPHNFTLKPGAWNYTPWATGSVFGQTPIDERQDGGKLTFCLPERLRTDFGGNTRHDGCLLLTLFRYPKDPFDPLQYNRQVLPEKNYWAPAYHEEQAHGGVRLYRADGEWPAWVAYDVRTNAAAFFLAERHAPSQARGLLIDVLDSIELNSAALVSYFASRSYRVPGPPPPQPSVPRKPENRIAPQVFDRTIYVPGFDRSATPPFFPIENESGAKGYVDRTGRIVMDTILAESSGVLRRSRLDQKGRRLVRNGRGWKLPRPPEIQ